MPSYQVASTFCHVVGCTFRHCLQVVSTVGMLARLACLTNRLAWTVTHHRQAVWLVEHFCKFVKQQASWHKACKLASILLIGTLCMPSWPNCAGKAAEKQLLRQPPVGASPVGKAGQARLPGPAGRHGRPGHTTPKHWLCLTNHLTWARSKQTAWLENAPHSDCPRKRNSCVQKSSSSG